MKSSLKHRIFDFLKLLCDSILPIIFWISLIFGFDVPYAAILTIISAIIHEGGHILAIYIISGKGIAPRGHSTGFRIKRTEALSYKEEIAILLSGPLANVTVFLISLLFGGAMSGYIRLFGLLNLATGLSNLLPIEGYDGYGALREFLSAWGKHSFIKALEILSFTVSVAITFIALHIIDRIGEGYWIFGLFFFTVISKIGNFGKYDIFEE